MPVPHKVVPCRYFLQGKCHRGAACTFKHVRPDGTEVRAPVKTAPPPPVVKVLKKPPQPPPALAPSFSRFMDNLVHVSIVVATPASVVPRKCRRRRKRRRCPGTSAAKLAPSGMFWRLPP